MTHKRLSFVLYWTGMAKEVRQYVRNCTISQRFKPELTASHGLLQSLPTPSSFFTDITIDFIEALPSSRGHTVVSVVVDRLSKFAHFMGLSHLLFAKQVAEVFFDTVFKLHGMPHAITTDRDTIFLSAFWKKLFCTARTKVGHNST